MKKLCYWLLIMICIAGVVIGGCAYYFLVHPIVTESDDVVVHQNFSSSNVDNRDKDQWTTKAERSMEMGRIPLNCAEIQKQVLQQNPPRIHSEVRAIKPGSQVTHVMCDFQTDGGDWTIVLLRGAELPTDQAREKFNGRTWKEHQNGFGDARNQDYWIGLDNLERLCSQGCQMRFVLQDIYEEELIQTFYGVTIANASDSYRIKYTNWTEIDHDQWSTMNCPSILNGVRFSTADNYDRSLLTKNCPKKYDSGWWFDVQSQGPYCKIYANINGVYGVGFHDEGENDHAKFIMTFDCWRYSRWLRKAQIKIR